MEIVIVVSRVTRQSLRLCLLRRQRHPPVADTPEPLRQPDPSYRPCHREAGWAAGKRRVGEDRDGEKRLGTWRDDSTTGVGRQWRWGRKWKRRTGLRGYGSRVIGNGRGARETYPNFVTLTPIIVGGCSTPPRSVTVRPPRSRPKLSDLRHDPPQIVSDRDTTCILCQSIQKIGGTEKIVSAVRVGWFVCQGLGTDYDNAYIVPRIVLVIVELC